MVDPDSATPLYVQLADVLRESIQKGRIKGRVPSVRTLTETYAVSHITAEKALAVLKDEGLVEPVVGKGFYTKS